MTASPSAILDTLEIDFDFVADFQAVLAAWPENSLSATRPFGLQTDVDDGNVLFNRDDGFP